MLHSGDIHSPLPRYASAFKHMEDSDILSSSGLLRRQGHLEDSSLANVAGKATQKQTRCYFRSTLSNYSPETNLSGG